MSDVKTRPRTAIAYEADFHAWSKDQAAKLRVLRPLDIDWENIAEEIESLGGSQRREIRSRLVVLLTHLLKWAFQAGERSNSWRASIAGARKEILSELSESPSLKRYPAEILAGQYDLARLEASGQTGLALETFPETCPFTIEQVLAPSFWPDAAAGAR
jgi:Domain of unknown function DUF29